MLLTFWTATAFSALCYDFTSFIVYGSVFGFTIGAYVGLTSVILVDLLGLDRLTNAFGLLLLFQGIASLLGPPIAGMVRHTDAGFVFLMAAAMKLTIYCNVTPCSLVEIY
jgi:MFS family permease